MLSHPCSDMFELTGYLAMQEKFGPYQNSWYTYFRQVIFDRELPRTQDLTSMQRIMRFNSWKTDPESRYNSGNSISARGDLQEFKASLFGGIDSKITSRRAFVSKTAGPLGVQAGVYALSGPTNEDQHSCPTFSWANTTLPVADACKIGQPESFAFPWMFYSANQALENLDQ